MEGGLPQSGRTYSDIHIENEVKSFPTLQVDLDHLLLDGGWKRGEVDWLRFVGLSTLTISEGIGPSLATACEDCTVRVFAVATGELCSSYEHAESATVVAFSPDGTALAAAGDDTTVVLYDVLTGMPRLKRVDRR